MTQQHRRLKTGDILITRTQIPLIEHFGVVVIEGSTTCVYHCIPDRNVTCDTLVEFLTKRELITVRTTNTPAFKIYERFKKVRHRRYNAVSFNCVHLAEFLTDQPK